MAFLSAGRVALTAFHSIPIPPNSISSISSYLPPYLHPTVWQVRVRHNSQPTGARVPRARVENAWASEGAEVVVSTSSRLLLIWPFYSGLGRGLLPGHHG